MTTKERIKDSIRHIVFGMLGAVLVLAIANPGFIIAKDDVAKENGEQDSAEILVKVNIMDEINDLRAEIRELRAKTEDNFKRIDENKNAVKSYVEGEKICEKVLQDQILILGDFIINLKRYVFIDDEDQKKLDGLKERMDELEKYLIKYKKSEFCSK